MNRRAGLVRLSEAIRSLTSLLCISRKISPGSARDLGRTEDCSLGTVPTARNIGRVRKGNSRCHYGGLRKGEASRARTSATGKGSSAVVRTSPKKIIFFFSFFRFYQTCKKKILIAPAILRYPFDEKSDTKAEFDPRVSPMGKSTPGSSRIHPMVSRQKVRQATKAMASASLCSRLHPSRLSLFPLI